MDLKLVVGLGNPGPDYDRTRHNAGAWLVEKLADQYQTTLRPEKKFQGCCANTTIANSSIQLLFPTTYMNHSGQAVKSIMKFYQLKPEQLLVAHDDLDLPAGTVKLKTGGGHGGHNGLRDIIQHLGSNNFHRVRVGIGHPGKREDVLNYVLGRPSISDLDRIITSIDAAIDTLPELINHGMQAAMTTLHTKMR